MSSKRDKSKDLSLVGKIIAGKYRVLRILGQGGCGSVFLVEIIAGMVGEKLALKILPEELGGEEKFRARFINEIRTAMRLVEKHIIQIRDVGVSEDGLLYYTMDFSPGVTLAEIIRKEGKLGIERSIHLAIRVLTGLAAAHAQGVIHRDLKPANLMVEALAGRETVRILDFGIATAIQGDLAAAAPGSDAEPGKRQKMLGGSLHYMPPEQFIGEKLGFYTDLYAVGVIIYECLTGRRPYQGNTPQEVFDDMKSRAASSPLEHEPELKEYPGLAKVVLKALERNPDVRYQSARDLINDLAACLKSKGQAEEAVEARADARAAGEARGASADARAAGGNAPPRKPVSPRRSREMGLKYPRRHPVGGIVLVSGAVLLSMGAIGYFIYQKQVRKSAPVDPTEHAAAPGAGSSQPKGPGEKVAAQHPPVTPVVEKKPQPPRIEPIVAAREAAEKALVEAQLAFQQEDWQKTMDLCTRGIPQDPVLAQDPYFSRLYRLKGYSEARLKRFDEAADSLTAAIVLLPVDEVKPELLLTLAEALYGSKVPDSEGAKKYLRKILELEPANAAAAVRLLEILDKEWIAGPDNAYLLNEIKKQLDDARAQKIDSPVIAQLAKKYFEDLPRQAELARKQLKDDVWGAFKAQKYPEMLEKGLQLYQEEDDPELGFALAEAYRETGKHADGTRVLYDLASRAAPDLGVYTRLALQFGQNYLSAYESAAEKKSRDLENSLLNLKSAGSLLDEVRMDDLRAKKKLRLKVVMFRARVLAYLLNWEEQKKDLKFVESEADRRQDPEIFLHVGKSAFLVGERLTDLKVRQEAFQRAIGLLNTYNENASPKNPEAYYLIGMSYLNQAKNDTDLKNANNNFNQAMKGGMKTTALFNAWGKALDNWHRFDEAAEKYRESFELSESEDSCENCVRNYMLAYSEKKDSRFKKAALEVLTRGINRFPSSKKLKGMQSTYSL